MRVPIRFKLLFWLAVVLLSSLGVYLTLAIRLMEQDKLAYAQDLNQNIASTLSAQVRAHVEGVEAKLALFSDLMSAADGKGRAALIQRFAESDPGIVRLVYFEKKG